MNFREYVPAKPFMDFLEREHQRLVERIRNESRVLGLGWAEYKVTHQATSELCLWLGVSHRVLYRYRYGMSSKSKGEVPTDSFVRAGVEDALERVGVSFADIYPEIAVAEDRPLEPERWCWGCEDIITPIDDECPWCAGCREFERHEGALRWERGYRERRRAA